MCHAAPASSDGPSPRSCDRRPATRAQKQARRVQPHAGAASLAVEARHAAARQRGRAGGLPQGDLVHGGRLALASANLMLAQPPLLSRRGRAAAGERGRTSGLPQGDLVHGGRLALASANLMLAQPPLLSRRGRAAAGAAGPHRIAAGQPRPRRAAGPGGSPRPGQSRAAGRPPGAARRPRPGRSPRRPASLCLRRGPAQLPCISAHMHAMSPHIKARQ